MLSEISRLFVKAFWFSVIIFGRIFLSLFAKTFENILYNTLQRLVGHYCFCHFILITTPHAISFFERRDGVFSKPLCGSCMEILQVPISIFFPLNFRPLQPHPSLLVHEFVEFKHQLPNPKILPRSHCFPFSLHNFFLL